MHASPYHHTCQRRVGRASGTPTSRCTLPYRRVLRVPRSSETQVQQQNAHATPGDVTASKCPVSRALQALPPPNVGRVESFFLQFRDPSKLLRRQLAGRPLGASFFLGLSAITVGSVEASRELVAQENDGYIKSGWPASTVALLGKESVTVQADMDRHRFLRKLLTPALGVEAVDSYVPEISAIVRTTLDRMAAEAAAGKQVLAIDMMKGMTFQVIMDVMDIKLTDEELHATVNDFNIWVASLFTGLTINMWPFPFHASMQARERLITRILAQVARCRAELAAEASGAVPTATQSIKGSKGAKSSMRLMITAVDENGTSLTDAQVADNLLNLLFAGHDTSSSQMTSLLFDLATRPEIMARLREEQAGIIAQYGPDITPASLRAMTYATAVASENMRLRPIIGGFLRTVAKETGVAGYLLPQGKLVNVAIAHMMKNDPRWPATMTGDPLDGARFNPDRFLSKEGSAQGTQVPFGMGPHVCAGMALAQTEVKIFLAELARGYEFTADTNTTWGVIPIPRPKNGLPIVVKKLTASPA